MSEAPHVRKYTEEFRQIELGKAGGSLFYFCVSHLGFTRLHDPHVELCHFLEGRKPFWPWIRALICWYRGSYKSTIGTQGYPLWRGLFIENFATKLIESNWDNVKNNHFLPMVDLFTSSPRAEYLRWLYQHRIPEGLKGWNSEQIMFNRTNPLAAAAISYWGSESRKEGWHGNLIVNDDLEGADAEKSDVASHTARSVIAQCTPLLEEPARDQVLVTGTPWGRAPLVWYFRDLELDGDISPEAQKKRTWKVSWKPLLKADGEPVEPERFPPHVIEALSKEPLYASQYLLLKRASTQAIFDEEAITKNAFTYIDPNRRIIQYEGYEFDIDKLTEDGHVIPERKLCRVNLDDCRFYLHADPTHRLHEEMKTKNLNTRPSEHALVVVAVAPDGHCFLVDHWSEKCDLGKFVQELMRLMRKWKVYRATYESVGAQIWLPKFVEQYERMQRNFWIGEISSGRASKNDFMVSLSTRLEEAEKTNEAKEWVFRERLAPYVNHGILHFHLQLHHAIIRQMVNIEDEMQAIDMVDGLSQGPDIWKAPVGGQGLAGHTLNRQRYSDSATRRGMGYHSPWGGSIYTRRGR